ncbi:MAG: response regulator transcription factor [Actinomycetota bacterium]
MTADVRVAVIDDHAMVRDGLMALLSNDERITVVGSAGSVAEAADALGRWQPQVLVVDDQLPDGQGTDLARLAIEQLDDCSVLIISGADRRRAIEDAIDAGCAGFLSKGLGVEQLADAVMAVAQGASVFPANALQARIASADRTPVLTDREVEVLALLGSMYAPSEVGRELAISVHTVRNHIRSILAKLGARSQLEAVVLGVQRGLIELPSADHDEP